jgi:hypothetical protein
MSKHHLPDAIGRRADDWAALAERAGISMAHAVEIDLDLLTDRTRHRLQEILKAATPEPLSTGAAHQEEAFDEIRSAVESWHGSPSDSQRAALHLEISRIYGHESRHWGERFAGELIVRLSDRVSLSPEAALPALRGAAESLQGLLPPSLRGTSKWLAAGGLAGALGCIAVASTIAPVVLTAIPMWSLVGAGLAAAVGAGRSDRQTPAAGLSPSLDAGDAIRSAVLFAIVLELQGRDEASISRILDRTLAGQPDVDAAMPPARIGTWLDEVRHRFDLALVELERRT